MHTFKHKSLVAAALAIDAIAGRQATPCQQQQAGPRLSERIKASQESRRIEVEAMEALLTGIGEEGRTFNAEEQKAWDGHDTAVKELDAHIARLTSLEKATAATANAAGTEADEQQADDNGMPSRGPVIKTKRPKVKGAFFARYAHALYKANGVHMLAAQYAEQNMGDKELGALIKAVVGEATSTTPGWAAELLQEEARDFIELLRPLSVYANFPAGSTFAFDTTNKIRVPRQTAGIPGGWVKEGGAIPVGEGAFDSITLEPYKLGIISVATAEVLSRSTPALETILRDSMLRDTGTVLDRRFQSNHPGIADESPAGLFHASKAPAPIAGSATGTAVDDMLADIANLVNAHAIANSPLKNPQWLMHPTTWSKLMNARNAVGAFYFRDEMSAGRLNGYPVISSATFDISGNGGGASAFNDLALIDGSMVVKANGMSPAISMSDSASVHMESVPASDIGGAATPVRSLWQTQSVGLRLTYEVDFNIMHKPSVQWIDAITW